jgi:hypothetical protein
MAAEKLPYEQTWRLLWSHAAYQVISALPTSFDYDCVAVGYGWGLRNRADGRRALLIHPSGSGREVGDLSLTVPGSGTQVIPRFDQDYIAYLDVVADIVETTARSYLSN